MPEQFWLDDDLANALYRNTHGALTDEEKVLYEDMLDESWSNAERENYFDTRYLL